MEWKVSNLASGATLIELVGRMDMNGALQADPAFAELGKSSDHLIVEASQLAFLASLGIGRREAATIRRWSKGHGASQSPMPRRH